MVLKKNKPRDGRGLSSLRCSALILLTFLCPACKSNAQELLPSNVIQRSEQANVFVAGNTTDASSRSPADSTRKMKHDGGQMEFTKLVSRMATSTLVVIIACILFLVFYRKSGKSGFARVTKAAANEHFRILQSINLGKNNSLRLVETEGTRFVVGVDATGIKSIVPVTSFADFVETKEEPDEETPGAVAEHELLGRLLKRGFGLDNNANGSGGKR